MSLSEPQSTDLVTQEDLDKLFHYLPIEGIWITAHGPQSERAQCFFHANNTHQFLPETIEYLASEYWLSTVLPSLMVYKLGLDIPAQGLGHPYICMYRSKINAKDQGYSNQLWGYWLLWTQQPLTMVQKYCIEQQVRSFQLKQQSLLAQAQLDQQIKTLKQTLYQTEHQLRTPLSLVEIYADLLYKSSLGNSQREHVQNIAKTIREISVSLNHLAHRGEASKTVKTRCDLKQILSETIEELKFCFEQKSITVLCDKRSHPLNANFWQLKQVFKNLFHNAISFSPEGGTISCHWQNSQNEILIEITDQGSGFSAKDLAHLFTPFYSRRCHGTGLGLVISRDIIQAHQGRLWAENLPSGGASMTIALPQI
ncbi:MAG: HAMP domain-containing sensor histidine kinase [Cyanobacteria bacterium J06639_14]